MQDEFHGIEPDFTRVLDEKQSPDEIRLLFMSREQAERITRAFLLQAHGSVDEELVQQIVNESEMKPA